MNSISDRLKAAFSSPVNRSFEQRVLQRPKPTVYCGRHFSNGAALTTLQSINKTQQQYQQCGASVIWVRDAAKAKQSKDIATIWRKPITQDLYQTQ
jgi:hypothetical protein